MLFIVIVLSLFVQDGALRLPSRMMPATVPRMVDLRSDTVTRPTPVMRKAMFEAKVGDDVFGEDPTVNALEDRSAQLLGKEQALFLPTGTMSNLAAIMAWCGQRGSEMILGDSSHIHLFEQGGMAQIAGVAARTLPTAADGTMSLDAIEQAIRSSGNVHFPATELIAIENSHNWCGGRVLPTAFGAGLRGIADRCQVAVHLDGARIWNAAQASGASVASLAAGADSVSACLSKGLGAPAGSLLAGPAAFISRARRARKALGGGMRQAGVLAAAGMAALDDFAAGVLAADHRRAAALAQALAAVPGLLVDPLTVQTNIVIVQLTASTSSEAFVELLRAKGVRALPRGPRALRLVLHRDVSDEDCAHAAEVFKEVAMALCSKEKEEVKEVQQQGITKGRIPSEEEEEEVEVEQQMSSEEEVEAAPIPVPVPEAAPSAVSAVSAAKAGLSGLVMRLATSSEVQQQEDEEVEEEVFYEEACVHGMSVSADGFCVFLQGRVSERIAKVLVAPSDPMVYGLDREQVESSEAVTLLQLLQGIDVESYLPKDALCGLLSGHRLSAVRIEELDMDESNSNRDNSNSNRDNRDRDRGSGAFRASLHSTPMTSGDDPSAAGTIEAGTGTEEAEQQTEVEAEATTKSSFLALALALRHEAVIEVRSRLLQNQQSLDAEGVRAAYPQLLIGVAGQGQGQQAQGIDRLQRLLAEAKRQGNEQKALSFSEQLTSMMKLREQKPSHDEEDGHHGDGHAMGVAVPQEVSEEHHHDHDHHEEEEEEEVNSNNA